MSDAETIYSNNWSELPKELLVFILSKMSLFRILNFRAVCFSWRSAVKSYISSSCSRAHQVPLLLLPSVEEDNNGFRFFSLEDKKVVKRMSIPHDIHKGLCLGTSHGWLVMLDKKVDPCLFNPFSLAQIPLPQLVTYPEMLSITRSGENGYDLVHDDGSHENIRHIESVHDLRAYFINKAILSSDPSHNNGNFNVLMLFELGNYMQSQLAFYRSGDSQWRRLGKINESYCDIICQNDRFFALNYPHRVEIWDILGSGPVRNTEIEAPSPVRITETKESFPYHCFSRSYLVESSGEVLLVERYISTEDGVAIPVEDTYQTLLFLVFKLDMSTQKWVEVESLSDQVLFLGGNQSTSLAAKDVPICEANSIYFTDDCWSHMSEHNIHYDVGVFSMEDKSIKRFVECDLMNEPPPFWISPTPLFNP